MTDRYDPKLSVRSLNDRNGGSSSRDKPASENDPLAELAKIVSGRSAYGAAASPRSRTVPAASEAARRTPQPDPLGDLEAELLSDLQAS
jgi:hypothetical protein